MARKRQNRSKILLISLCIFCLASLGVFIGFQFVTKTGLFKVPGVVYYDESLEPDVVESLQQIFTEDVVLENDLKISEYDATSRADLKNGEYVYKIKVPVGDFYDTRTDQNEYDDAELIPIEELDYSKKLLSVDGKYFLDTFDEGAYYKIVRFESDSFDEEIKPLVNKSFSKDLPNKDNVLSFAQTGVTALSRGMNEKLVNVGGDAKFFSSKISDYLKSFDLTHTSNESSFSEMASPQNICSDPRFIDTLSDIGLDIVELTGNHNQDCGDEAANETIDLYQQNNIKIVGGGKNAEDAARPLNISQKGNNITFLAYNLSTGGATLDDTPGANQYVEENAAREIESAKNRGDFVIVDMQYYECSAYASEYEDPICDYADSSAGDQIGMFRHLVDLGADLVGGTSAHQPQTFELYNNGVIYYG